MKLNSIPVLILLSLLACKKNQNIDSDKQLNYTKTTKIYKNIPGVNSSLSLDIYYDTNNHQEKPVIIWVHGGGWCIGDKANQMTDKKALFARLGYILVSVNYRLSPFPYEPNNPTRIKFPVHNNDIADAVKWIYDHIADYGGNPDKLALLGHSAGAHLVALTGTNQNFLNQAGLPVQSIKGIAAIDTKMYDVYHEIQNQTYVDPMYINAFGTDPQENIAASPIRHLMNAGYYPKFLIAKRGNPERLAAADSFIQALQAHQINVSVVEANMYTHAQINAAIGMENETIITPALVNFLKSCFDD